jgi:hypothetical protein
MVIDDRYREKVEILVERLEKMNGAQQRLMDVSRTATYLGRTPGAVEHLVKRGTIAVTKLDGKIQIDREVLDELIKDVHIDEW